MAAADYDECLRRLLVHEGGYTNDAADPGGPTNWGVTIYDARKYWKPNATAADVKAMPKLVAQQIYRAKYWDALNCDALPAGVDDSVFDYGVNSGIARAGKVLRSVVGLPTSDWHVTAEVLAAVAKRDAKQVVIAINTERLAFLRSLKTWPTFGKGWSARVAEVHNFSLSLVASPIAASVPAPVRPPASPSSTRAKAIHPEPKTAKTVAGGGGAAAAVGISGWSHWIGAHPVGALLIGVSIAAIALVVLKIISAAHEAKQTTPMPVTPVPATA